MYIIFMYNIFYIIPVKYIPIGIYFAFCGVRTHASIRYWILRPTPWTTRPRMHKLIYLYNENTYLVVLVVFGCTARFFKETLPFTGVNPSVLDEVEFSGTTRGLRVRTLSAAT